MNQKLWAGWLRSLKTGRGYGGLSNLEAGRTRRLGKTAVKVGLVCASLLLLLKGADGAQAEPPRQGKENRELDALLAGVLRANGFTGTIDASLPKKLGRKINGDLADLGRNLFHDRIVGLAGDNSCAGCHSATAGFGDTQSIAIGTENNLISGPNRKGPRNQRRSPTVANTAFYPTLMWNSRFSALSNDPFDRSYGFVFPLPEGMTLSDKPHLLVAQAFIPPTERVEAAGFECVGNNQDLRNQVIDRINAIAEYRRRFGISFPEVRGGARITYDMFAKALAEFEFTLVFANAPLDRFARGDRDALTEEEKRGAVLFFGKANCVLCHAVKGKSNEMFSDFKQHVVGVPQIMPSVGNVEFDGLSKNEDFGREQFSGNPVDRYAFRTSPIRNVALQPAFFHNGAFTRLEDAIRFHLNPAEEARVYHPADAGVAADLQGPMGPLEPVLAKLDPLLRSPVTLSSREFSQLVKFVRNGLLDRDALPEKLSRLIPKTVPSGIPLQIFEGIFGGERVRGDRDGD